jgi:ATP-binding cassette, subfamily B, multidrug efflux pump
MSVDEETTVTATSLAQQRAGGEGVRFGMPLERSSDAASVSHRLAARMRPERFRIGLVVLLAGVSAGLSVAGPYLLGHATDVVVRGVSGPGGIDTARLTRLLVAAAAVSIGSSAASYIVLHTIAGVVQRTMKGLRADVERKLHRLPLAFVDGQPRGDLLSRVTNDVDNIAQSLQQTLGQLLTSTLTMAATITIMLVLSPVLFLVVLVTVPTSLYCLKLLGGRARGRFGRQWRTTGALNAQVEEVCAGHAIVTAFGRQDEVERQFAATNEELHDAALDAQLIGGVMQPLMMVANNLTFVGIAVVGGLRVASGAITIGTVQAFIQYSRQLMMPLGYVASMASILQSGLASAERVFELLDAADESPDPAAEPHDAAVRGLVAFEDVTFSYLPDRPLIERLSFVADPGETVAIVGPTGAGKTTLVNLLMRFYDVQGGRITLDGRDTRSMPRHQLRSQIGMVLQDTWLFDGTIRENIRYGNPSATDEDVVEAARAAYVDRFVHALPDGYDTRLDDSGRSISAGEKQLITIARAFLADPAILVLDEATSSVDTRTEVLVQEAMAALRSNRTCFVIAHRLSTIREADTILVMDQGQIVEQGDHSSLIASGGAYAALYAAQFAGAVSEVS